MINKKAIALAVLLGLAALASPSWAQSVEDDDDNFDVEDDVKSPSAFLMLRRKPSDEKMTVGKVTKILVEVFNTGDSDAKSVTVKDEGWRRDAFHIEGQLEAEFASIPAGGVETFSFSVTPKAPGVQEARPILATYLNAEDAGEPVSTRSSPLYVHVYTGTELLKYRALEIGSTLTLGILKTEKDWVRFAVLAGGGTIVYMSLGTYRALAKSRAESRRRRALKDLGLDDLKTK